MFHGSFIFVIFNDWFFNKRTDPWFHSMIWSFYHWNNICKIIERPVKLLASDLRDWDYFQRCPKHGFSQIILRLIWHCNHHKNDAWGVAWYFHISNKTDMRLIISDHLYLTVTASLCKWYKECISLHFKSAEKWP